MKKIYALKKIDEFCGRLLCLLLFKPVHASTSKYPIKSALVIRPGGIGDAVLLIPAISALKRKYSNALITVLAETRNVSVFELCPHVDKVLLYDKPKELLAAIRGEYDVVFDTEQWHRLSAVIARITKSPISIGYATNERQKMFTNAVHYSHDEYEIDSFFRLLEPIGLTGCEKDEPPFLVVPDEAVKKANALLGELADKPFIAIFPGSSIPEKRWDIGNFVKLVLKLNQAGLPIIVIGSEKERAAGEVMTYGLNVLNLTGKTSLVETAALIDKSSCLVSGDSGVLHLAVGLGKPTVSLFGPSNLNKWAPRGDKHIVVSNELPCSPCAKFGHTPKCFIKARCMADLTVAEVVAVVEKLLRNLPIEK